MKLLNVPHVAQFHVNACGAAALEMVYKYYEKNDIKQEEIFNIYREIEPEFFRESIITTENLVSDAKSRGFEAFWKRVNCSDQNEVLTILKDYLNNKIPIIVCQQFTKQSPMIGHFRVVIGVDGKNNISFYDPQKESKVIKWPINQFMDYWQRTGRNVTGGVYIIIKKVGVECA